MRKIAVMEDFLTKAHMEKLRAAAERLGFAVDFYPKNVLPDEKAGEYEVIYGNCDPGLLKKATGLKWICCSFAGVDPFLSDDVYPNPDVLLSNSSGAYGTTIAEHIMMVTLMLLRRMPEFQGFVREHKWVRTLPMRSIYGSEITVLGTGDTGTSFARRAKAMVAKMDELGFGNCTNTRACEMECPKNISVSNIARLNREFISAKLKD